MPTWLTALLAAVLATLARDIARDLYGAAKNNWKRAQRYLWLAMTVVSYLYMTFFFRPSDPVKPSDLTAAMALVSFMCIGMIGLIFHHIGRILDVLELNQRDTTHDAK